MLRKVFTYRQAFSLNWDQFH